ncbi:M23 family metallopeptidase [Campylobacter sp. RM9333]|uniref:M23 family metallopeptidase n=1 Tax=Campylobacter sp. RM9333 TaxID=2735731 RepID=UPI001D860F6B|nr:M23 family metallopeptidase [Campylobacter sp. RM9333]
MRNRNKKTKITIFFSIIIVVVLASFIAFSNTFERIAPNISLDNNQEDTIYWNARDKINLKVEDNLGLKNLKVEFSKDNEETKNILINKTLNGKEFNVELDLPKPKFNEKLDKYTIYIKANDKSLWNWFGGNVSEKIINVIVDNKKPQVSVIANSYNITQGGAASVVFYAQDDNLTDLYIEVNNRIFKVVPFMKDDYYIALIAWDLRDGDEFEARIVAKDKANNIIKERIPYYYSNKKYKVSHIEVGDAFIDGKIRDLYEANSDNSLSDRALIFDFVNAKLRQENEKLIHKVTQVVSNELVTDFKLNAFLPLKNGMKVADFGDHRYYKYNGNQISESYHMGLDLASTKMAPIVLGNDGKIVFAQDNGIYGLNLIIDHGLGLYTLYGHCTKKNVEIGDIVNAKSTIANTGTSGLALGDHLHFGVLVQGVEVRPEEWMDTKWLNDNIFGIIKKAKEVINKK